MAKETGITAVTTGGEVAAGPMTAGTEGAAGVIIVVAGTVIARVSEFTFLVGEVNCNTSIGILKGDDS